MAAHFARAEHLVQHHERDAALIAEHFARAEQSARSLSFLIRAARDGLDGGSVPIAISHIERGIAAGASGEELGHLLAYRSYARGLEAVKGRSLAALGDRTAARSFAERARARLEALDRGLEDGASFSRTPAGRELLAVCGQIDRQ